MCHFLHLKEKREKNNSYDNKIWCIINSRKKQSLKEWESYCVIEGDSSIEKVKTPSEISWPLYLLKNELFFFSALFVLRGYFHCSQHFNLQKCLYLIDWAHGSCFSFWICQSGTDVATLAKIPRNSHHLYRWTLRSAKAEASPIGTNSNHPSQTLVWYSHLLIGHRSLNRGKATVDMSQVTVGKIWVNGF